MEVVALVMVEEHSEAISPILSDKKVKAKNDRPERLVLGKFAFLNRFDLGEGR